MDRSGVPGGANPYVHAAVHLGRWLVYGLTIGAAGACVAWAFDVSLRWVSGLTRRWWMWGLPLAGAAAASLVSRFFPKVRSDGIQEYIFASRVPGYDLEAPSGPAKFIASLLTLGSGGSGGKVGPVVFVGGVVGRVIARLHPRASEVDLGEATTCGAAAAVGALLGCPLGGGLFAAEVLHESAIDYKALFGAILCSVAGFLYRETLLPIDRSFVQLPFRFEVGHLVPVLAATAVAGLVGLGYVSLYRAARRLAESGRLNLWLSPLLGAAGCMAAAYVCGPGVLGVGEDLLRDAWMGRILLGGSLLFLAGKILATVSTVGMGGSGGMFFPAAIVGGLCGSLTCNLLHIDDPALRHAAFTASVAASIAGMLNAPVAAAVIQIELHGVGIAPAAVLGSVLGFLIGRPKAVYRYSSGRRSVPAPSSEQA